MVRWERLWTATTIWLSTAGYSGYSGQPLSPGQPPANGYNSKGKGYAEQQPVQHIGLFGVSSGSGSLPINNV
eukprot:4543295-Amphidinium_carterae.1